MTMYRYAEAFTGMTFSSPIGMATDGAYLYFGNNSGPPFQFHKVDKNTMAIISFVDISAICIPYGAGINSTVIKGGFAYAMVYGLIGCVVIKIRISDMSVVATYPMVGSGFRIATDGTYFYIGFYDTPARVAKYDINFNQVAEWIGGAGDDWVWALLYENSCIYVALDVASPAYVLKLDLNLVEIDRWTSPVDEQYAEALTSDGTFLYVGINDSGTVVARVKKVDIATMTTSGTVDLLGSNMYGIGYNNGRVFVACNNMGGTCSQVNIVSVAGMTLDETLSFNAPNSYISELAFFNSIGVVVAIWDMIMVVQDTLILLGEDAETFVAAVGNLVPFSQNRQGLIPASPYTLYSYASLPPTEGGAEIIYSSPVPFTTLIDLPLVTTLPATVI